MMYTELDDRDRTLLSQRAGAYAARSGPRVGDYVDFSDDTTRRISYVWNVEPVASIQTSDGGSFYLGNGYCSFSGGLYPGIPADTLVLTDALREGAVWFFHHDYKMADNGVETTIPCRVYRCSQPARA